MTREIVMIANAHGADDGINVRPYLQGKTYKVGADLFKAFVDVLKVAKPVSEAKDAGAAPGNKSQGPAPENKARRGRRLKGRK